MTPETRPCRTCGTEFPATRGRRYCSSACWPSRRPFAEPGPSTEGPRDYAELIELLWSAAERGSVSAMSTLLREVRHDGTEEPKSIVDELAKRRKDEA